MKRLSKDVIKIMNMIGNARFRAVELAHTHKKIDTRDLAFVLSDLEDRLYDILGITHDEFVNKYRELDNYDLEI